MMEAAIQKKRFKPGEAPCPSHPEKKAKFFCRTHELFLCSDCLSVEHLGHDTVPAGPLLMKKHVDSEFDQALEITKKLEVDVSMFKTDLSQQVETANEKLQELIPRIQQLLEALVFETYSENRDKEQKVRLDLDEKARALGDRVDAINEKASQEAGLEESNLMLDQAKRDRAQFAKQREESVKSIESTQGLIQKLTDRIRQLQ